MIYTATLGAPDANITDKRGQIIDVSTQVTWSLKILQPTSNCIQTRKIF
jgi:hypothetical protein